MRLTRTPAVVAALLIAIVAPLIFAQDAGAGGKGDATIEASSSASGQTVIAASAPTGYTGKGYSGFDGVLDCTWYENFPSISNPLKDKVDWSQAAVLRVLHLYWFQCIKIGTPDIPVKGFRTYDPGNGSPWFNPPIYINTWAFRDWDRLPLPRPALQTSPPAAMHVVNLESWFWAQIPPEKRVRTYLEPANWSLVTATVKNLTLDLGEPGVEPVVCPNGGVPWTTSSPKHDPNACTYTFTKRGPHHITATLTWAVTATGAVDGQPINATAPDRETTTELDITVNEIVTHIKAEP